MSLLPIESVEDYEYLTGIRNEAIIKEVSIAGENVLETFHFQSPYAMMLHGDTENGLNLDDGHIPYHKLSTVQSEAVAGFAHLYGYGESKYKLLSQLLGRLVHNLEYLKCPSPWQFIHKYSCTKPCHRNPCFRCATRHAHSLYDSLMFHLQKMSFYLP